MTTVDVRTGADPDHFRLIFDASPVGMALVGLDGSWIDVNPACSQITGYERADLLRRDFQSITHPDDLDSDVAQVQALLAGETTGYQMRKRYLRPSGEPVWVLLAVALVREPVTDEPRHFVVQIVEVDAQVRAEAELENRTKLFSLSFEASLIPMAVGDEHGILLEVNQALCDLLGRERDELLGRHPDEFTHPEDRGIAQRHAQITDLDPSHESRYEKRYLHRDGHIVWVEQSMSSVRNAEGQIRRLVHIDDIGAKRQSRLAEEADREWLERLVQLQREITVLVGDRESVMVRMMSGVLELMHQADGVAIALWTDPDDHASGLDCVAAGGVLGHMVGTHLTQDGSLTGIVASGDQVVLSDDVHADDRVDPEARARIGSRSTILAPLLVNGTETLGVLSVFSTQMQAFDERTAQLTAALAHSLAASLQLAADHERLAEAVELATQRSQAIELASDAVILRDLEGRIVFWSSSAERLYGWTAQQVAGAHLDQLLGARTRTGQPLDAVHSELMQFGSWEGELEHQTSRGRFVTVLTRKAVQRDRDGEPVAVLTINTDITARRRAEEALIASEALFRSQFEHSAVGLAIRGTDDVLESVNPALAVMLGCHHPGELVGTSARAYETGIGLEDRQAAMVDIYSGRRDSLSYETALRRRDGSLLDVNSTTSVLRDRDGRPERFISIIEDISERKRAERARDAAMAELEAHNQELADADRLKTDLIGMLGHEINNPLSVLSGAVDALIMASQATHSEEARVDGMHVGLDSSMLLPMMSRSVHRIGDTVREILAMVTANAGRLTARPRRVVLGAQLRELVETLGATIEIEGDTTLEALVQPEHLEQIATNLISNATKYADGLTRIRILRQVDTVVDAVAGTLTGAGAGMGADSEKHRVGVQFIDAGAGVPEEFRSRLFDRFTRAEQTADEARGTGLGLFICRELARANGGDLTYGPGEGGGSVFELTLPMC